MTHRALTVRETAISIVINAVLSFLFFVVVFGWGRPVGGAALGRDFLPQAFMVALMGSLVPGLLMRRHGTASAGAVVRRAVALALAGLIVAGGGAFLVCRLLGDAPVAFAAALAIKVAFGAMLAALVTPVAVRAVLPSPQKA